MLNKPHKNSETARTSTLSLLTSDAHLLVQRLQRRLVDVARRCDGQFLKSRGVKQPSARAEEGSGALRQVDKISGVQADASWLIAGREQWGRNQSSNQSVRERKSGTDVQEGQEHRVNMSTAG